MLEQGDQPAATEVQLISMAKKTGDLISDKDVKRELSVSGMTIARWDLDPKMAAQGWPRPVRFSPKGAKFRARDEYEKFKAARIEQARKAKR